MKKSRIQILMAGFAISFFVILISSLFGACASQVAISGYEGSTVVVTNAYTNVLYHGSFWKNDLWEDEWQDKKSRRHTLKIVRVKLYPWQAVVSIATLGIWVPMYLDWEFNGDVK